MTGEAHPTDRQVANPAAAMATPRQLSRLERVVLEIVETEQAYVRDLKSIVEVRTRAVLVFRIVMSSMSSFEGRASALCPMSLLYANG